MQWEAKALSFVLRAAGGEHHQSSTRRVFTYVVGGRVGMNDTCYFTLDMKKLDPPTHPPTTYHHPPTNHQPPQPPPPPTTQHPPPNTVCGSDHTLFGGTPCVRRDHRDWSLHCSTTKTCCRKSSKMALTEGVMIHGAFWPQKTVASNEHSWMEIEPFWRGSFPTEHQGFQLAMCLVYLKGTINPTITLFHTILLLDGPKKDEDSKAIYVLLLAGIRYNRISNIPVIFWVKQPPTLPGPADWNLGIRPHHYGLFTSRSRTCCFIRASNNTPEISHIDTGSK